jgi:hypothetical protein
MADSIPATELMANRYRETCLSATPRSPAGSVPHIPICGTDPGPPRIAAKARRTRGGAPTGFAVAGQVTRRAGAVAPTADPEAAATHQRLTVSRSDSERPATILLKTLTLRHRAFHPTAQSAHLPRCSTIDSAPDSTDQFAAVQQSVAAS